VRAYLRYGRRVASLDTLVRFGPAAAAHQRAYTAKPPTRKAVTGLPDWVWAVLGAALLYGLATGVLVLVWRRRRREDVMPIEAPPPAPTISSSRQAEDEEQQASGPAERLRR
jgi:hypothetical protein